MEGMKWSWSRLNSFDQGVSKNGSGCGYGWKLTYIDGDRGDNNFFGEYGILGHDIIEKYNKKEIFEWDIDDLVKNGLTNIKYNAPFSKMKDAYVQRMKSFFCVDNNGFESFEERFKDYNFLESELEINIEINGKKIGGYIDALADHKKHGFILIDYKSAKPYEDEYLEHNLMQLYLYSIGAKEKYGKYPDKLMYYYFKEYDNRERVYDFDMNKLNKTINFVKSVVDKAENFNGEFIPRCLNVNDDDWYANYLCNHRFKCPYSKLNK